MLGNNVEMNCTNNALCNFLLDTSIKCSSLFVEIIIYFSLQVRPVVLYAHIFNIKDRFKAQELV